MRNSSVAARFCSRPPSIEVFAMIALVRRATSRTRAIPISRESTCSEALPTRTSMLPGVTSCCNVGAFGGAAWAASEDERLLMASAGVATRTAPPAAAAGRGREPNASSPVPVVSASAGMLLTLSRAAPGRPIRSRADLSGAQAAAPSRRKPAPSIRERCVENIATSYDVERPDSGVDASGQGADDDEARPG